METSEARRDIAPAEIGSLEYRDCDGDPCLVPSDWRVAHGSDWHNGRGYRDVHAFRDHVLGMFPASAKRVLTSELLGPPIQPSTVAYMSLFEAAYWIATKGGSLSINVTDSQVWRAAFDALLRRIASEDVGIIGRRVEEGIPDKIAGHVFASIQISYPYIDLPDDLPFGEEPYIECYGRVDEEHWRKDFSDKLFSCFRHARRCSGLAWSHLEVKADDLARFWPFEASGQHALGSDSDEHRVVAPLVPSPPVVNSNGTLGTVAEQGAGPDRRRLVSTPVAVPTLRPRGKGGRPAAYDWPRLVEPLRRHIEEMQKKGQRFESIADLINWCIENVKLRPNATRPKGSSGSPNPKTVRVAIGKHGLAKNAGLNVEG
jgi:hypothetical protein